MNGNNPENFIPLITTTEPSNIPLPDLVVSNIQVDATVFSGYDLDFEVVWTITNQGDAPATGRWFDNIYLSHDDRLSPDDYNGDYSDDYYDPFSFDFNETIGTGESVTRRASLSLPDGWEGEYYVIVATDRHDKVFEHDNEDNNLTVADQLLTVSIPPLPDLVVSDIQVPTTAFSGTDIEVVWTITNQGDGPATGTWSDNLYLSEDGVRADYSMGSFYFYGTLAAGESLTRRESVSLRNDWEGDYYLTVVTDAYNHQFENDNEDNNTTVDHESLTITVPPRSDLVVSDITVPLETFSNQDLEIVWTVTNQGDEEATGTWNDLVYLSPDDWVGDDQLYGSFSFTGTIAPGESVTRQESISLPLDIEGPHYVIVTTDGNNQLVEYNQEDNNTTVDNQFITITVPPQPDLVVSEITVPLETFSNQDLEIVWTVTNQGDVEATGTWNDLVYLSPDDRVGDDQLYGSFSFTGTLAPGETLTRSQLISLPVDIEGPHYVIVTTDGNNQLVEYNQENNNTTVDNQFITIPVPPQPDLVVSEILVPLEAFSQQDIEIVWTVTNQGDVEATGTWNDLVYLSPDDRVGDDQFYGSFSFTGTLAPGESLTRKQLISLPLDIEGPHYVIVTTDGNNQLVEYNQEHNNTIVSSQELTIALSPFPNLQVEEVIPPPTAFSGQETLVEWIVVNNGTGATSSSAWIDQVWLSLDQTLDSNDTFLGQAINPSYLNQGDSYNNSLTVTLPRGIDNNYFFIVQTDARNQVLELHNEGDNNKVSGPTDLMLTPPPDLQVTSVNAPGQGFSGQPLILSWTVTNEGPGDTLENSWSDTIYLSADNILDDGDIFLGQQSRRGVLATGQSYQGTGNFALPVGISDDFFIIVQTDAHNQVFEHIFDGNNTGFDATPTTINLTPPPDLEVELVDAPAEATASRSLSINYRVTNFGATPTPNSSWQDSFYLSADNQFEPDSDLFLGQRTRFGALDIGEFYSETATFTLPHTLRGDFFVFAIIDSADRVFELDNDNNLSLDPEAVTIVSRPADLVISTFTASSAAEAGKSLLVDWTVSNQGTGDTVARAWTDNIVASIDDVVGNFDDVILGRFSHRELLDAGDSYSRKEVVTIPFSFAGDYNLFAVTDAGENVYEDSNETNNNSAPLRVTVTREIPDLQVTTINVPSTAQTATIIPLSWTVQNFGQGQTNSNFWYDEVFLSTDQNLGDNNDILLGRIRHNNLLAPEGNYAAAANLLIPLAAVGDYYVIVRTDADDLVFEETLENNNDGVSLGQISIEAHPNPDPDLVELDPDLVVESVAAPAEGFSGQSLEVTWTVRNDGDSTGSRSWFDSVYLSRDQIFDPNSDIFLGSSSRSNLAEGNNYTATANLDIPRGLAGPFYVFVATDSNQRINEPEGEFNNSHYDPNATQIILLPPGDLVAGTITVPVSGTPGEDATLTYTVENQGTETALGRWTDSLFISADEQWDVSDPLFAQVSVAGPVNQGDSYSRTVTAPLPGVVPGDYHVIVRSDIRNNIPEEDEENNLLASVEQFNMEVVALTLGVPHTDDLAQEQWIYYQVDVPAEETLVVTFHSVSADGFNELYVSQGEVPTRADFDFAAIEPFSPDQQVVIPTTEAGTYFIQAFGNDVFLEEANFDITAELVEFSVFDDNYGRGGNVGNLTIEINGAKFDRTVMASIVDDTGVEVEAVSIFYSDSTKAYATFDLRGVAPAVYDVVVENGLSESITVEDGLEVVQGGGSQIIPQVNVPRSVGRNREYTFTVSWGNSGLNDGVAPVIFVNNTVPFGFSPGDTSAGSSYTFLGQNTNSGPPGILRPGQSESRTFFSFSDNQDGNHTVTVDRIYKDLDAPFDWEGLRSSLTPVGITDAEFDPIFNQLIAQVGTTTGDYLDMLSRNGVLLPEELGRSDDVGALLGLELRKAKAAVSTSISGVLVADELNVDISGRTVIATNIDTSEQFEAITLNDGSFSLVDLSSGTYTYEVGFAPFEAATPTTTVTAGGMVSGLSLEIGNGATIIGEVEDASSQPIADAVVAVYQGNELIVSSFADVDGSFEFTGLEAGTYRLETYLPDSLDSLTQEVTLTADEILTVSLSNTEISNLGGVTANFESSVLRLSQSSLSQTNAQEREDLIDELTQQVLVGIETLDNTLDTFGSILSETVEIVVDTLILTGEISVDIAQETIKILFFSAIEQFVSPAVQAGAYAIGFLNGGGFSGGSAARNLYNKYFYSVSPNDTPETFADGSTVSNSFEQNPVTQQNLQTIQSEALQAIQDQFTTLPCNHPGVNQTFDLNSLNIPSSALLNAIGGEKDPGDWDFNFRRDLAGVIAGGNGEGGGPGSRHGFIIPDKRTVEGTATVTIPPGSSLAEVVFDITVTIKETVDFDPGNTAPDTPFVGKILAGAKLLENNKHAFDVPFISTFEVDPQTFNFSVHVDNNDDNCNPPPPPPPGGGGGSGGGSSDDSEDIQRPVSRDPNDILGPEGFGEENWIAASSPLSYTIRFENDPIFATAPAQVVRITQQLDLDLDFRTFRVGDFGFGDVFVDVPENRAFYQTRLDLTEDSNILVDVIAGIDIATGEAFWEFTSVEPETGELPLDALTGFLPPNLNPSEGEGFVNYSVASKTTATTGTVIDAEATIVFDINEPIDTPPIFNTLDAVAPTSTVAVLPKTVETEEFLLSWSGSDDEGGSAIASYTIYVSEDGSAFAPWLEATNLTEATFVGEPGHSYEFYSVARDNAGNLEAIPSVPQAHTQIAGGNTPPELVNPISDRVALEDAAFSYTFQSDTFSDADLGDSLTYEATLEDGNPLPAWLSFDGDTRTLSGIPTQSDVGTLSIAIIATDNESATATDTFSLLTVEEVDPVVLGEVATVTDFNHLSQTINFSGSYHNPVVIAGPLSFNGGHTATVRIESVTADGFTAFIQEPSNLDGRHTWESFSYLVLEAGTWQWPDGTLVEVGTIDTNATSRHSWETINFDGDFEETPAIFSFVQSYNGGDFVRTRQRDDSQSGFRLSLEEEERKLSGGHLTETVGYVAIDSGSGSINGLDYTVGSTPDKVNHRWYDLDFDNNFAREPNFLAQLASYDGPNSAGLRYRNLTDEGVQVFVEDDTSQDSETLHTTEVVDFLAIADGVLSGYGYDPVTGMALINGTDSDEIFFGTEGDDSITGGLGSDVFVLGQSADVVSDFTLDVDKIGLTVEFEELAITQVGGDSVVGLGLDSLTLTGVDSGLLSEDDFVSVVI